MGLNYLICCNNNLCYNRGMNLKETENFKFLANLTSFILLVVGLILRDWMFLFAALLLRSTTISIVIYHKDETKVGGFTRPKSEDQMINTINNITLARPRQKTKAGLWKKITITIMDENEKGLPSKNDIMLALTTMYSGDFDFLDNVNRVTFGLISKRTKNDYGNTRSNHRWATITPGLLESRSWFK